MEFITKTLYVLVPLVCVVVGICFLIQGINLWLDITGPPKLDIVEMAFDHPTPFEAKAFIPDSIRIEQPNIRIEVRVKKVGELKKNSQEIEIEMEMSDDCDYIQVAQSKFSLFFNAKTSSSQSVTFELKGRNIRPPRNCTIKIEIASNKAVATLFQKIPINVWKGMLLAVGKSLLGILMGLFGGFPIFKGLYALFS